ncbi:hypothetical protein ABCS02_33930 [Microbacterium sp. X-17]|uniref:hypothetical protein n=1 Tax=Microbacterium sp. X-17 TaxID=3144404 RepID=UPI0031F4BE3A
METYDGLVEQTGFTVEQGRAAGLTRRQLDGGGLQRPFRGVRTVGVEYRDHRDLCRAYAAFERGQHTFSHQSAAMIHGFPLPHWAVPKEIHVAVFAPAKPPQMVGVVGHELRAAGHKVVNVDGLRVTAAEDTWAQLSRTLPFEDLVVIGDWLVTGDEPHSNIASAWAMADLDRAVRHHARRPGIRRLRLAFEAVRYGPLSPQETRLRLLLVSAGLPEPELNYRVLRDGRSVAMVDLAFPERRVAIEYLGDIHRTDRSAFREDIARRERLTECGWNVVFLTADDLKPPVPRALLTVRRALARSVPE